VRDLPFLIVDVFTDRPLAGNQLAVFTDAAAIPEDLLQPLALEMGFSETVFILPARAGADARIRIFTPANELPFAGHPVLGTGVAFAIERDRDHVRLETGAGPVPIDITTRDATTAFGWMRQPIPSIAAHPDPEPVFHALGVDSSQLPVEVYDNGVPHLYVALTDEDAVAALTPDFAALNALAAATDAAILGFNCFAGSGTRWKTRMFAPANGVPEDAATGSAAGPLACHLARHGRIRFGEEIAIAQGVEIGRPSALYARARGSLDEITGAEVGGSAVVVASGAFRLG
jgi:trans-2,3-dihydro-3-hydroxyanthranilate isomerase